MEKIGKCRYWATNNLIAAHIDASSRVIEIGSNDGSFRCEHRTSHWTTVDKFGDPDVNIDLDGPNVALPFEDRSIDLVICTEVLEHLRMGSPLVAEFGRVLKTTGVLIASVPNICSLKSRMKVLCGQLPNMAASGDSGHPLGGTGVLVDGRWVAGHVVDFNLARLRGYLFRGGLDIFLTNRIPAELILGRISLTFPGWLLPPTLGDFLLVAAKPISQ